MSIISPSSIASKFSIELTGVIHVGAHEGEEIDEYLQLGLKQIRLFEANEDHAQALNSYAELSPAISVHYVAISDRQGSAAFNLMSNSQASSLLHLKIAADVYPDITAVSKRMVQTNTLDNVLRGQNIEGINLLSIDIQGAELAALRGAEYTLRGIDIVIVEVNFAEMYEGCPLVEEIDLFLFDRGFVRVETSTPFHSTWGDAAYVRSSLIEDISLIDTSRRHCVTMSSFGSNGRFANQLFQYLFMILYGFRSGCNAILPQAPAMSYLKHALAKFQEADLPKIPWLPVVEPSFLRTTMPARDVDIWGYFQGIPDLYRQHERLIRKILEPRLSIMDAGDAWLRQIRSHFRRVVGIHIRRGDYVEFQNDNIGMFSRVPTDIYRTWLKAELLEGDAIFISTDDESELAKFDDFPVLNKLFPRTGLISEMEGDFYLLSRCDIAAYCNSSWSLMSSLMASPSQKCYIIDFSSSDFVPFDPWKETQFWRRFMPLRDNVPIEWDDQNVLALQKTADVRHALERRLLDTQVQLSQARSEITDNLTELARSRTQLSDMTGLFCNSQVQLDEANVRLAALKEWSHKVEFVLSKPVSHLADFFFSRLLANERLLWIGDKLPFGTKLKQFFLRSKNNYERYKMMMRAPS